MRNINNEFYESGYKTGFSDGVAQTKDALESKPKRPRIANDHIGEHNAMVCNHTSKPKRPVSQEDCIDALVKLKKRVRIPEHSEAYNAIGDCIQAIADLDLAEINEGEGL